MKILYIADGRSPIAIGWISQFARAGYEVHLVSTFPCSMDLPVASVQVVSAAFSASRPVQSGVGEAPGGASGIRVRSAIRHWFGPFTLFGASRRVHEIADSLRPDLIHALRIPFEGMVAARAGFDAPLLISVWGNDFTLHAPASPGMRRNTRRALEGTDGLHTDCQRDIRLAIEWGFSPSKPKIVLPGGGGIDRQLFRPGSSSLEGVRSDIADALVTLPNESPMVVNPRGFRRYVRTDTFFQSIPMVLDVIPETSFFCVGMAGKPEAERWIQRLGIESGIRLLPYLTKPEMAEVFRRAVVSVSPSEHDGTPNSFLEAIACGVFPIVGDIESLREWITPGANGFLVDPGDPQDLASATIAAILDGDLRASASTLNQKIVDERAEREIVGERARHFYQQMVSQDR